MTYRPVAREQLPWTPCGGSNCACESCAMGVDRTQLGVNPVGTAIWPPTGPAIRVVIGGACGGTTAEQNDTAAKRLYGVTFMTRYGVPWPDHCTLVESGRGARFAVLYSAVRGTRWDSCPSFSGRHAMWVNERQYHPSAGTAYPGAPAGWYWLVVDPLADGRWLSSIGRRALKGHQWWPDALVKKATGANAGTGKVNASYTIDTEWPNSVTVAGAGVYVRRTPTVFGGIYGQSESSGIRRDIDGSVVVPLSTRLPLTGWVTGGAWRVGSLTGDVWAAVLLDNGIQYIAKALVRP